MKLSIAAFVTALFAAGVALAAGPGDKQIITLPVLASDDSTFSAEDMTGPAQTNVFDVRGLDYVQIFASAASVSGTADVTTNCFVGPDSGDANYHVQSEAIAAGVATQSDYVPTKSVTTSDKWLIIVPTQRAAYMYCTFTATSGTMDISVKGGNL